MIRSSFVAGTRFAQLVGQAQPDLTESPSVPRRRGALLAGTALAVVLGAATMMPQSALAQACVAAVDVWNCNGPDADGETITSVSPNTVINLGPVTAFDVSNGGDAFIVNGLAGGSNLTFNNNNNGNNSYTSTTDDAIDIDSNGGNVTALTGFGGPITAGDDGIEVDTDGGNITIVTSTADVIVAGDDGVNLEASDGGADGGNIDFTSNAGITAGDDGIFAETDGPGNVTILVNSGAPIVAGEDGIDTEADSGATNITVNSAITAGDDGIEARAWDAGHININANAAIVAGEQGIEANSDGGNISVITSAAGTINATNDLGIDVETEDGGTINVNAAGNIVSDGDSIRTEADDGATTIVVDGTLTSATGDGVDATAWGQGHINITANQAIVAGDNGIEAESDGGNISVITAATGTINATSGRGIEAETEDGGTINVNAAGNIVSDGDGIHTEADDGATTIIADGAITTATGDGIDARAWDQGNISVTSNNTITSGDTGIVAISDGGDVTVQSNTIDAGGSGVIAASFDGSATVTSTGPTTASGLVGLGALAINGNAEVTVGGKIISDGFLLIGAGAASVGGSATVNVNADIDPPLIGALALTILGTGDATVNVNAHIDAVLVGAAAVNILGGGDAIVNISSTGSVTSDGIGVVAAKLFGPGDAIVVANGNVDRATAGDGILVIKGFGDGNTIVAGSLDGATAGTGNIGSAALPVGDDGIQIVQFNGDGNTTVNMAGSIWAIDDGVDILRFNGDGAVNVTTGAINAVESDGIELTRFNGDGDVNVTSNGAITAGDEGIDITRFNGDGNLTVNAVGAVNSINDGVDVTRFNGDGAVSVTTAAITSTAGDGIDLTRFNGDGQVDVVANGAISALDDGIQVLRFNGDGNVNVTANAAITTTDGSGISVIKFNGVGDVNVTTGVDGDITTTGGTFGILAFNEDGNTTVVADGDVIGATLGVVGVSDEGNANVTIGGKVTASFVGAAAVSFDADATLTVNAGAHIDPLIGAVVVAGGNGVLANAGTIDGDLIAAVGLTGGTFTVNNSGTIQNVGGGAPNPAGLAIFSLTGDGTIVNNLAGGTITGTVAFLGAEDDTFNNNAGATWNTGGSGLTVNLFGFGNDVMNNAGTVFTGGDPAASAGTPNIVWMLGLNTWNNDGGILDMRDGKSNDVTWLSGVFFSDSTWNGNGNSRLGVDSFLSYRGDPLNPGVLQSDLLVVGNPFGPGDGITQGVTGLVVNDTNPGPGAFDPVGIPVVLVDDGIANGSTALGHFNIHPDSDNYDSRFGGVIDKGAFIYFVDLREQLDDEFPIGLPNAEDNAVHVLRSAPDADLFQFPGLITGAQNVWWDTTGVWHQRVTDLRHYLLNRPYIQPAPVVKGDIKDRVVLKAPPVPAPVHVTPGAWLVASGNWSERDRENSVSVGNFNFKHDTGFEQKTFAFMGGFDFGSERVWGPNDVLMFGLLAGYIQSDLDFNSEHNGARYSGPTVGGYMTYINERWFVDAIIKADFLDMKYSSGWGGQEVDATSIGGQVEAGYRQPWTQSAFYEPLVSIGFVHTDIGNLTVGGLPVSLHEDTSVRGSLGLRVGTTGQSAAGLVYEASIVGRVWNEFGADNSATVVNPNPLAALPAFVDDFSGVFGQVGVKLDWFNLANNWSAFVTGDYRFNGDYQSVTGKIGARTRW